MHEKTDTITIRVPESLKKKIEELSVKNNLNLNLQINQIISKNIHWDEHVVQMGWLQFDPAAIREIFKYLNEDAINSIATSIRKDIVKSIKFIYGDASFEHTIEFINSWLTFTNIPFRHSKETDSHKFLVTHNLGENWSRFAVKVSEEFITDLGFKIVNITLDKMSYGFTIRV